MEPIETDKLERARVAESGLMRQTANQGDT